MIDIRITTRSPEIVIDSPNVDRKTISVDVGAPHSGTGSYEIYDGPTMLTPRPYDVEILLTQNKVVKDDIVMLSIPYYETSNPQGGTTVYIGD